MKSWANPPPAGFKVSVVLMMMLDPAIDAKTYTWRSFNKALADPNKFMNQVKEFQPETLSSARLA